MLNKKDFEGYVHRAVHQQDPSKGVQDTGVGGQAPVNQTIGDPYIGPPQASKALS
jgi:hypothetical protein